MLLENEKLKYEMRGKILSEKRLSIPTLGSKQERSLFEMKKTVKELEEALFLKNKEVSALKSDIRSQVKSEQGNEAASLVYLNQRLCQTTMRLKEIKSENEDMEKES